MEKEGVVEMEKQSSDKETVKWPVFREPRKAKFLGKHGTAKNATAFRREMKKRRRLIKENEKKIQLKMKDAIINGTDHSNYSENYPFRVGNEQMDLEEYILLCNARHLEKLAFGKKISDVLKKNEHVSREGLPTEFQNALYSYETCKYNMETPC